MTQLTRELGKALQGDFPLTSRPFQGLAQQVGSDEWSIITTLRDLIRSGMIRRFGAILRHQLAGYTLNAMVVWSVPTEAVNKAGRSLAAFREVTHCYERTPAFLGRYNLFTMVHFRNADQKALLAEMAAAAGVEDFLVLQSKRELKKVSMQYF